ncbi:hypothetical protein [Brucella sp.]|uniref:hypothetical protein n=1 Tax=Brucella sp. TaxID=52132 RepID=UPI00289693DC|nr:hypothetical protein [Brucella sp.]
MRNAIIDNSTLTAVQRLLGEVEIVNSAAIDGDIAAFENLVQAVLFYDNLFFIDDYKPEFKEARHKQFPYLIPLSRQEIHYDAFMNAASDVASELGLRISDGKIDKNEIGAYLERVGVLATFRWDQQSSEFLLKMKMIENSGSRELFSILQDMVFTEKASANEVDKESVIKNHFDILNDKGAPVPKSRGKGPSSRIIPSQLTAFAGSVNWLTQRALFYTYLASSFDADAILHPIRSDFQATIGPRLGMDQGTFTTVIKKFSGKIQSVAVDIKSSSDPIVGQIDLPIFSAWLVNKTNDPKAIIEAAFEVRSNKEFVSLRNLLSEMEDLAKSPDSKDYVKYVNTIQRDIEKAGETLKEIYGVKSKSGVSIAPMIFIINTLAKLKGIPSIPSLPIKIKLSDSIIELGLRSGFKGVFRSVISDLTSISRLGEFHDKITSSVVFKGGSKQRPILPTVHPQRYMGYSTSVSKRFED